MHGIRTDDEAWQVEDVAADREAERGGDGHAVRLEEHAVRVDRLRRVLERVRGKVLPVLNDRLVLKELGTVRTQEDRYRPTCAPPRCTCSSPEVLL